MTTPSPKPTCPTCRRRPSERTDYVEIHDGNTGKFKYVKDKRCSDPIHDLADRLVAEHATPRASEADALRAATSRYAATADAVQALSDLWDDAPGRSHADTIRWAERTIKRLRAEIANLTLAARAQERES